MRTYALTYPQLMAQAARRGLGREERLRLRRAHVLAQGLSDGLYRKYDVPFLCHLVRTASVALEETRSLDVVVASMLHAAYFLHVFEGSRRRGPRVADRAWLRAEVGEGAEALIALYPDFPFDDDDVEGYAADVASDAGRTRALVLMSLANELEDHLDAAEAYAGSGSAGVTPRRAAACTRLAEALGHPTLAADLAEAFALCETTEVPDTLRTRRTASYEATRLWRASPLERLGAALRRRR